MDVYLSGISGVKKQLLSSELDPTKVLALESFYSIKDWQIPFIPKFEKFLLDSGAFTFLSNSHKRNIVWDQYVERYAQFINQNNIRLFFELDIDSIVGINEVERLRHKLERLTNKMPIVVWHKNRGKEYFVKMCEEYPYVAIGGIAAKEIPRNMYEQAFPWFINEAHKRGVKIHGLGYTDTAKLHKYKFDSVDSTTWTNAGRFGEVHYFNGKRIQREGSVVKGVKIRSLCDPSATSYHNFKEWVKFSEYAKNRL